MVSTVGRVDALAQLLDSLSASSATGRFELVLVDQSDDGACTALLEGRSLPFRWQATTSERGLSRGRNAGARLARGDHVGFPDDDCWYAPDTIERVLARVDAAPSLAALSGRALGADGRPCLLRWLDRPCRVTPRNYYRTTIAITLFLRRSLLEEVGGFDVALGAGSTGWFGSGEESDLVLRLLAAGHEISYDPSISVYHPETRDVPTPGYVEKMLRYGAGQGHLWRVHHASPSQVAYLLGRKLGGAALRRARGQGARSRADLAYVRGCIAGLRDVPPRELR